MAFRQYQTRVESVMAERFFEDKKPWPEGVYLKSWSGTGVAREIPTVDTISHGPFPVASGDWVVRFPSGRLEVYGDLTFNENYELRPDSS